MTPLVLLVGFLGSGKTTFLKKLLPCLQQQGLEPHVIINDYQNAKVDAEQVRELAAAVAAISGDCVCCGSRDELVSALANFEHAAGRLAVIETNGTTDSEQLIEMLSLEPDLKKFSLPVQLTVIDAQRWQKRFWHNALEREQTRTATHVFLSRTDTVTSKRLEDVEKSLADLHIGGARVGVEEFAEELASICRDATPGHERSVEVCSECGHAHHEHDHEEHEGHDEHHEEGHHHHHEHHFASLEAVLPETVIREDFLRFLKDLPDEVIRAKGVVKFADAPTEVFIFQKVDKFDDPQFFPSAPNLRIPSPLALFIGPNLPADLLLASVRELSKV